MNKRVIVQQYIKDLEENVIPFWERAIDQEYGGVFTCFTNNGADIVSDRKYIWSQGRFLWLCCQLITLKNKGMIHLSNIWESSADQTYTFLNNHALMQNEHCVFAVEREGAKIQNAMDTSIFADCFYVLGCNAYARLKENEKIFNQTLDIYQKIKQRVEGGHFLTEPYPIPKGYKSHAIPMILINVATEVYETARFFNNHAQNTLLNDIHKFFEDIFELFDGTRIVEMKSRDSQTLLSRHLNPGHTLESAWFMVHGLKYLNRSDWKNDLHNIGAASDYALSFGWDKDYGGLFRFADKNGDKPFGENIGVQYEKLINETWDTKLWWPHAEALYTTLLLYEVTGNNKWKEWFQKVEEYTFQTFPNDDKTIGEWIQIRNRKGDPLDQVVALPVKDPFHIMRSYILIIHLLGGGQGYSVRNE